MNRELVELALGANRVMTYAGYVLLAGTFTFWSLVWPEGRSDRRLVVLAVAGTGLLFLGTIGGPGIEMLFGAKLPGDVLTPLSGAALLVRLERSPASRSCWPIWCTPLSSAGGGSSPSPPSP